MAQPYYDDGHPLEEYLTELVGEAPEQMPGSHPIFSLMHAYAEPLVVFKYNVQAERLCFIFFDLLQFLGSLFSSDRVSKRTQAFAERFKYGIISSSLLSASFPSTPAPHPHRRSFSPSIPGRLASNHSRSTSITEGSTTDQPSLIIPTEPETHVWPLTLSITLAAAALSAQFYSLFVLLLLSTLYYMHVHRWDIHSKPDIITPSLEALQNLITAGSVWDAVVHDTLDTLENEERSTYRGPSTPMTPSSSLRVTLSTSLLTTQTQCDNVRQLLSAIASPHELAQLSEMYAPPSPMKLTFCLNSDHHRPLSLPGSQQLDNSTSVPNQKRSTWNGSYSALAQAGSPTSHIAKRREKRRSDLSALLGAALPSRRSSVSAPTSPSPPKQLLDVVEEDEAHHDDTSSLFDDEDTYFGAVALDLRRKRRCQGMGKLNLSSRNSAIPLFRSKSDSRRLPTMSPASKYTSMQTTRHPLSISSLNQALQCALASKRYACSHLLALRFEEDDDEAYWEDVRSLMSLLTTTLIDASSRLTEVLDEIEEQHLKDEAATGSPPDLLTSSSLLSPPVSTHSLSHSISHITSFAPMPGDLARFAAHVDAISSALNGARDHLEQCVTSLKDESSLGYSPCLSTSSVDEPLNHPALLAYERLRRELGIALRECERGRERLTNVVLPPSSSSLEEPDDLPTLAPDMGSDDSDKPEEASSSLDAQNEDVGLMVISPAGEVFDVDDASPHLLLTASSHHLPPPGIEQIFEAETENSPAFTRERSRLTREERIKLAKARRESAEDVPVSKVERWGPGGEVVQELKDVIRKVGERRRRMTEEHLRSAASSIPTPPHGGVTLVEIVNQSGVAS